MNTIYRIVWNAATGKWVVASELAKGRKKKSSSLLSAIAMVGLIGGAGMGTAVAQSTSTRSGNNTEATCGTPVVGALLNPAWVNQVALCGTAIGDTAKGLLGGTAVGDHAATSGFYGVALGAYSLAGTHATAVGPSAMATGSDSFAGGVNASAMSNFSVAIGNRAKAGVADDGSAVGYDQIAIGSGATAQTQSAVAIGQGTSATGPSGATAIGWGAKANASADPSKRAWSATSVGTHSIADGDGASALGDSAKAQGDRTAAFGRNAQAGNVSGNIADATAFGAGTKATAAGSTAIGSGASATASNSVAVGINSVASRDNTISVGTAETGGQRQIVNVAAGTANTDAVNVSQLKSVVGAIGGGSAVGADGTITAPSYSVGGTTVNNVGAAITNIDGRVTTNTGDIANLKATVADAVMYDSATHDSVTLGGTSASSPVALKNIAAGTLSGTSTEAVNGSQLFATNTRVTKNEGDITNIRNQLGSGSIGLVLQDEDTRDITVAAATDGDQVNFAGTDGARKLAGVAAGELSATSTEAVNGAQLFATNARVTKNEGDIIDLGDRITNGSVGLVQQAGANAAVTVAAATGGTIVDFTGTDGTRQLKGVSDGADDTDAVNVRQLKSAGLVGDDGSLLDAVVYDVGSNRSSITLGGVAGTTITNVMAGLVAPGSMDAINGSQLWGVQDQINKLGDRVTTIENGAASPGPIPVEPINPGSGNPHFASSGDAGKPATASGSSSVAAGEGAMASGSNSTAIGAGSSATGNNSVAIGAGSVADGDNTVSVGSVGNERRIANVAAGTQRTDAANVGQLQDAMSNLQDWTQGQVNGLSKKVDNVQRQANRGIAASAALVNNMPYLPGKVTLNAGVAAYRGQSALGVGVSRWNDSGRVNLNAGVSAAQGDSPIFRVGVGVVLGD